MADLRVVVADTELTASWTDTTPETRAALTGALPVEGHATRWGDEPRAASPVSVLAELDGTRPLADLDGSATVRIEPQ